MTKAAAEEGGTPHLPEQPSQTLCPCCAIGRQECTELFREVDQNRARLEDAHGLRATAVHERWNFGVRVDLHKAAAELVALIDSDQPRIILGPSVSEFE